MKLCGSCCIDESIDNWRYTWKYKAAFYLEHWYLSVFSLLPTFNIWIDIYFYACIWIFFGTLKKIQFWIQEESNTFLIIEIQLFILFSVYVYGLYQIRFYS